MKWVLMFSIFIQSIFCGAIEMNKQGSPTFIDCWKAGMIENRNGKISVAYNRLAIVQDKVLFIDNGSNWIDPDHSLREILGVANIEDFQQECKIRQTCPRQHVGFYWSSTWNLWFCLNECPYNFHKNFPKGKEE